MSDEISPMSSDNMASHSVFQTTELMESILRLLPLPSLLRVQAVCKEWQTVIRDSLVLQQQLFLKPVKDEIVWLVDVVNLPAQQGWLRRDYKSSLKVKAQVPRHADALKTHCGLVVTPVRMNSLFLDKQSRVWAIQSTNLVDRKVGLPESGLCLTYDELRMLKTHSARNMFLTQPPVRNISLEVAIGRHLLEERTEFQSFDYKIYREDGVKLQDILSKVEKKELRNHTQDIRIYMNGIVEPSEDDEEVIHRRTIKWRTTETSA